MVHFLSPQPAPVFRQTIHIPRATCLSWLVRTVDKKQVALATRESNHDMIGLELIVRVQLNQTFQNRFTARYCLKWLM